MDFGFPNNNVYRAFQAIPANLAGAAGIAANDILVAASRRDPWIRAASTSTTPGFVPAFTRSTVTVSFDFILCGGNGSPVALDCVELIFSNGVTDPQGTTAAVTGVTAGTRLLDEPIATALVAEDAALLQAGRRVIIQANSVGRVTGTRVMTTNGDCLVIVRYRHILTSAVALVAAT